MSFAATIATRNGTEGSNFHIWNTMTAIVKVSGNRLVCTGWFAQVGHKQRCKPTCCQHFNNVFQMWKFEPSVPFLVAMIAAKDMKCVSFPNLALPTLLASMYVLVTINAHLLCLTHSLIDSPSFLFFTPFCSVYLSLCLVLYYAIRLHFFAYTLFWWNPSD